MLEHPIAQFYAKVEGMSSTCCIDHTNDSFALSTFVIVADEVFQIEDARFASEQLLVGELKARIDNLH